MFLTTHFKYNIMKTLGKLFLFAPVFAFLLFSCSKDETDALVKEGGPFKISELAGSWEATSAFFVRDSDNMSVDIIGDGGTISITIQSSGRFTLTIDPADRAAYTVTGEMFWEEFEGNYFFAMEWDDYPGDWDTYGATLSGTTFSINGSFDTAEYDFNNNGTFESASINMVFIKV